MIETIYIKNFGIIEEAELRLGKGFNVITGETGTGKSMIVNAMGLVFGRRLGSAKSLDSSQKTIIEMSIDVEENLVGELLDKFDIDRQFPIILRREIATNGRSRAFVNDTPASNAILKELATLFVDVSEQHETLSLSQKATKFNLVDGFANNGKQLQKYQTVFSSIQKLEAELEDKEKQLSKLQSEQDYFKFQLDELETLSYVVGEEQDLKEELELLENAEVIKKSLSAGYQQIAKEEYGLIATLNEVIQSLKSAAAHHKYASDTINRLSGINIEIADIGSTLESEFEQIEYNPERLQEVEERLSVIYKLIHKHGIESADELLEIQQGYSNKLASFDDLNHEISFLISQRKTLEVSLEKETVLLTKSRQKQLSKIEKEIKDSLKLLAMPSAEFSVLMKQSAHPHFLGNDDIELLFSANNGVKPQPINQVASGGELSRLMLATKSLLSIKKQMPTLIFDEIDSGISGETAARVGEMMQGLSKHSQLLVVSHLPQIAAKADHHFIVEKSMNGRHTFTKIRKLNREERVDALATMVSGNKNSSQAKQMAMEMLG